VFRASRCETNCALTETINTVKPVVNRVIYHRYQRTPSAELFGYSKGAFTDAKSDKPGQFSLANDDTLLLVEISEMDVSLQVKLSRVLDNGEYCLRMIRGV